MISVDNVSVEFNGSALFSNVTFNINDNDCLISLIIYLQNYNKCKFQTLQGDYTIFSNHHQLYFSESKLNSKLDEINYNKDDINNICAKAISISKGINLEVGKEQLQKCRHRGRNSLGYLWK